MKLVYQYASNVVCWLGPAIEGIAEAIALAAVLVQRREGLEYKDDQTLVSAQPAAT